MPALILESYQKCQIELHCYVIEDDGSLSSLAAAISCASLSLIDAGFEMRDVVVASTIGFNSPSDSSLELVVDPSQSCQSQSKGLVLLAYMPSVREVTNLIQSGEIASGQLTKATQRLTDVCVQLFDVFVKAIIS
jgi:exosome complex component MTR3